MQAGVTYALKFVGGCERLCKSTISGKGMVIDLNIWYPLAKLS